MCGMCPSKRCQEVVRFVFSSRRRHTRCALVTGVQTCALPIYGTGRQEIPNWSLPNDHPTLYLEHTERPENLDPAGGTRRPLRGSHDRHHEGRAIQSGFPGDQPEQQASCDPRSGWACRCAVHAVRIRCNPTLSPTNAPTPPMPGPTPNGRKISILLEELGFPYEVHTIDITKDDQFSQDFLAINPNNKIPAIIDPDGPGDATFTLFESGAILIYLAKKHQSPLWPDDPLLQARVLQWLMFQMGGVGPMFGQLHHFRDGKSTRLNSSH